MIIEFILLIISSYLLGSISSSIITAKIFNLPDPRTKGSKNAGATNMLRIGGKKVAIITLIFDILKGIIPVVITKILGFNLDMTVIVTLFVIVGHIFPIFFNFKGGKGVATFIGALTAISFYLGLIFVAIWLLVAKVLKISSIAAIIATILTPIYFYILMQNLPATIIIAAICVLIIIKHKENIARLINKEEDNINDR